MDLANAPVFTDTNCTQMEEDVCVSSDRRRMAFLMIARELDKAHSYEIEQFFVGLSIHRYVHANVTCTSFYFLQARARTGMVDANTTVEICPRGPNVTVMKITPWMRTAKHAGVGDMQP